MGRPNLRKPTLVQNSELEDKVLTIFKKIGVEVSLRDTEACHHLKKDNDRVIVKMQEVGLPGNRSIFINTNVRLYCRMLWSKYKRLHDLGKICNFYISSGTMKV